MPNAQEVEVGIYWNRIKSCGKNMEQVQRTQQLLHNSLALEDTADNTQSGNEEQLQSF